MRKKLTWWNSLIIFFSLFILLFISCLIVSYENTSSSARSLNNYLQVGKKSLENEMSLTSEENALEATSRMLSSSDSSLRVTVISEDGSVLIDTSKETISENHSSRPEIENPGTIYYRYSTTMKKNMMYLASLDTYTKLDSSKIKLYFRLAMPQYDVNELVNRFIIYGSVSLVVIFLASFWLNWFLTRKAMKPLKDDAQALGRLCGENNEAEYGDESEEIARQIDHARLLIQDKMATVSQEKKKLALVIDTVSQGLIICSGQMIVLLINKAAKEIFNKADDGLEGQSLLLLSTAPDLIQAVEKAEEGKREETIDFVSEEGKTYLVSIYSLNEDWCSSEGKDGVGLSFTDITSERKLAQTKRDFFANASHELKSPLTSISGYAQMLKDGIVTDKSEEDNALGRILSESKRMNQIIVQMLELSRLESEENKKPSTVSLLSICMEAVSSLEEERLHKGVTITCGNEDFDFDIAKEDAFILLQNLLENAIRYNRDNGQVKVTISTEKRTLSVSDNGIGIPAEDQERIFERFYRVDKAKSRKLGGTGLGLSIVKHICLNYNISINVDSQLGKGSTFTLTFPSTK